VATIAVVADGAVLAFGVAHAVPDAGKAGALLAAVRPLRTALVGIATGLGRADAVLRRWPVATLSLLVLDAAFSTAMWVNR